MGVAAAMAMLMLLGCSAAPPGPPTSGPADGDNWTPSAELELKIEFLDADSLPADAASAGALEAELVRRQILNALQAPEMSRPLRDEDERYAESVADAFAAAILDMAQRPGLLLRVLKHPRATDPYRALGQGRLPRCL